MSLECGLVQMRIEEELKPLTWRDTSVTFYVNPEEGNGWYIETLGARLLTPWYC